MTETKLFEKQLIVHKILKAEFTAARELMKICDSLLEGKLQEVRSERKRWKVGMDLLRRRTMPEFSSRTSIRHKNYSVLTIEMPSPMTGV